MFDYVTALIALCLGLAIGYYVGDGLATFAERNRILQDCTSMGAVYLNESTYGCYHVQGRRV